MAYSEMDERELEQVIRAAQAQLAEKRMDRKAGAQREIERIAKEHGLRVKIIDDITPAYVKGGKVPVKFRHGANEWTGRGVYPRWLNALLQEGRSIEEFRVSA